MSQAIDYGDFPLVPPPPGEVSNFVDPPNRDIQVYFGMGVMLTIATLSMIVRVYTRLVLKHAWAIEDLFIWIGYAAILTHDSLTFTITGSGPGRFVGVHTWDVKVKWFTQELMERSLAAVLMYNLAALFVKLSLLSLYLRLFRPSTLTRRLIYAGMAACSVFYVTSFLVISISCTPDPRGPNDLAAWFATTTKCDPINQNTIFAQGIFGTISDIYLLALPIQIVSRLQLATKRKIGICAVFMTGVLAIACSMASLVIRGEGLNSDDTLWLVAYIYIFSNVEVCAGIICVNTPLLPAIVSQSPKKPVWLRLPENLHYFSLRRTGRPSSSRKPLVGSKEVIVMHDISIEHQSNESVAVSSNPNSDYGKEKGQYHIDISGREAADGS